MAAHSISKPKGGTRTLRSISRFDSPIAVLDSIQSIRLKVQCVRLRRIMQRGPSNPNFPRSTLRPLRLCWCGTWNKIDPQAIAACLPASDCSKPCLIHCDTKLLGGAQQKPKLRLPPIETNGRIEIMMTAALGSRGDQKRPRPGDTVWVYDGGRSQLEAQMKKFLLSRGEPQNELHAEEDYHALR